MTAAPALRAVTDDQVLDALVDLHEQHRENLCAGGFDPAGARVRLDLWRAATGLDVGTFAQIVKRVCADGRVVLLHLYAWPTGGTQ